MSHRAYSAVAGAIGALAVSAVALAGAGGSAGPSHAAGSPPRAAGTVVARIPARGFGGLAVGAGSIWVVSAIERRVSRIDPGTNRVVASIALGKPGAEGLGPAFVAAGHGSIWVGNGDDSTLVRIDPATNRIVGRIPLGTPGGKPSTAPLGIAVAPNAVWVANHWPSTAGPRGSVVRVDPRANRVAAVIPLGADTECCGPTMLAAGAHAVWVGVPSLRSVVEIDPATNKVVGRIRGLDGACGSLAIAWRALWIADCGVIRRADVGRRSVAASFRVGGRPLGLATGYGSLWARSTEPGWLFRLARSGRLVGRLALRKAETRFESSLAVGFGSVWVRELHAVVRVRPHARGRS